MLSPAVIHISLAQYQQICQAVISVYPQEGCGLILGRRIGLRSDPAIAAFQDEDYREATVVIPVANTWSPLVLAFTDPGATADHGLRDRYWIDPATLLKVQQSARQQGIDIIGIYHSHPDHPAVPSECDRRLAWPVYSYLITSVCQGEVKDLRSWRLDATEQFQPEPVKILGSSTNNLPFLS
jgi:proteasome lid subunit RPN8/RPN11